jgi:hypothetical protein
MNGDLRKEIYRSAPSRILQNLSMGNSFADHERILIRNW